MSTDQQPSSSPAPTASTNQLTYSSNLWDSFFGITTLYSKQKEWMKGNYHSWKHEAENIMKTGRYYEKISKKGFADERCGDLPQEIDDELKQFYANVGEKMVEMATLYDGELFSNLKEIKYEVASVIKDNTALEKKLEKELKQAQAQAQQAQKQDASQCQTLVRLAEARRGLDDSTPPKKVEKMNKQLNAALKNAQRARSQYEKQIDNLQTVDSKYYSDMGEMLDKMQRFDEERLQKTKDIFLRYAQQQAEVAREILNRAEQLKTVIQNTSPEETVQHFIKESMTNSTRPAPDTFQPYFSDATKMDELVEQATGEAAEPASLTNVSPSGTVTSPVSSANTPSSQAGGAATPSEPNIIKKVKSLYEYQPEKSDEIELQENDIIEVYSMAEDGWWHGLNMRTKAVGDFPSNFTEEYNEPVAKKVVPPPPPTSTNNPSESTDGSKPLVTTLYDYVAQDPSELSFGEGEQLRLLECFDDGWSFCESVKTGQKGLSPLNYTDYQG